MAIRVRSTTEWLTSVVDRRLSPEARRKAIATHATVKLKDAEDKNLAALGRVPDHERFVDGRKGAALTSVNPDHGTVVFRFELLLDVVAWVMSELRLRSPVLSGAYRQGHRLFVDGREIPADGDLPPAEEYSISNTVPYARRLEIGKTRSGRDFLISVPNRIYERTAKDARARFGNVAKIGFTYRGMAGGGYVGGRAGNKSGMRYPTITVRPN